MNRPFSKGKAMLCHINGQLTKRVNSAIRRHMGKKTLLFTPMIAVVLSGCVQVQAPDKPIVINLNIQIRQEVLYRLDQASKQVIDKNPGIF
jgi:YnbE-like lipoprotein